MLLLGLAKLLPFCFLALRDYCILHLSLYLWNLLDPLRFRSKVAAVTRVLVLTPTRELALQCQSVLNKLSRFTDIRSALVVGGLDAEEQQQQLRTNPDIIIATPGRLIDHILNTQSFGLESLEVLILDEADRLLGIFTSTHFTRFR